MNALRLEDLRIELKQYWNTAKADFLKKYFTVGTIPSKEIFRGVTVPNSRKIAKKFVNLDFNDVRTLLEGGVHEEKLIALFILVLKYQRADVHTKDQIVRFYLKHTEHINSWDLVDSSASFILGDYLLNKDRHIIYKLVCSDNWWERRISVLTTAKFIANKEYQDIFKLAELLLEDKHDLIHKAVGWMLREVGKRISPEVEKIFLNKHYQQMPRTMLRYAIEHFPEIERHKYLKGSI